MRAIALLMLIIIGAIVVGVPRPVSHVVPEPRSYSHVPSLSAGDPKGSPTAFNYTNAQADLYTRTSNGLKVTPTENTTALTSFRWLNTVPRTINGGSVIGSGFRFNITTPSLPPNRQNATWTVPVPKSNCGNCTKVAVDFNFFGNLTKGTSAAYRIVGNGTVVPQGFQNFTGPASFPSIGTVSISGCPATFCVDVTKYIGYNLTVTFGFSWNSSETGMAVEEGELAVASIDTVLKSSASNLLSFSNDPAKIIHIANMTAINYNSTVRYLNGPKTANVTHVWAMEIVNLFYPEGYSITQVRLNSTIIPNIGGVPFETQTCFNFPTCTTSLFAINVTDIGLVAHGSTINVNATSSNTISGLTTLVSGAPVNIFEPNDSFQANVTSHPSVMNMTASAKTGQLNITIVDPAGSSQTVPAQMVTTAAGGNATFSLPPGHLGVWKVYATFTSGFDLGFKSTSFTVETIQLVSGSFKSGGSNSLLNVQGKLDYNASITTPAANVNGIVFAVDSGNANNSPITTTNSSSPGLYISNVTLVNGIFTQGRSLIMLFTVANFTIVPSQGFAANVTIEHEWSGSQTHGVKVMIPLTGQTSGTSNSLGDEPFTLGPKVYRADLSFTASGVQVKVTSLSTGNSKTGTMSTGSSPVPPTRQHTGILKIIVNSVLKASPFTKYSNSLESPPYAYVPGLSLAPSKYLAYSKAFTTDSTGAYAITLQPNSIPNSILGAKKLVVFALARDSNGVVLLNDPQNVGPPDSTLLQSTLDPIPQVTVKQTVQGTLHLTSNSSSITEILVVRLNLQGSGIVDSRNVTITPGATQVITFQFTAPSSPGLYAVTFSSLQYGAPFASQTLQVAILQGYLQFLIPALTGLVAAIIVLGYYLIRRPAKNEQQEKTKPAGPKPKPKSTPDTTPSISKSLTQT